MQVVTIDLGVRDEIHPPNKSDFASRLADSAEAAATTGSGAFRARMPVAAAIIGCNCDF